MKKYLICLSAVVVAFIATSFTVVKQKDSKAAAISGYRWYNFNGGLLEMCDPSWYSLDSDNFPDCPPTLGIINCEIYALPSEWDADQPDLSTVLNSRVRPLL